MSEKKDKPAAMPEAPAPQIDGADADSGDTPRPADISKNNKEKAEKPRHSKKRKTMRFSLIVLEISAVVFLMCSLALGALVWRLQNSPIDVAFAMPYVQQALAEEAEDLDVRMDGIVVYWPDLNGPLLLGLKNARLLNADGKEVLSVDEIAIGLSKRYLLIGRAALEVLLIKKAALSIVRDEVGRIDLGLGDAFATIEGDAETQEVRGDIVEKIMSVMKTPGNDKQADTTIARMERIMIEDAQLHFEDQQTGINIDLPSVNLDLRSLDDGLMASMGVALERSAEAKAASDAGLYPLEAQLMLGWESKQSRLQIMFNGVDFENLARQIPSLQDNKIRDLVMKGVVLATLDENFMPVQAATDLAIPSGSLLHEDFSAEPVPLKDVRLNAIYSSGVVKVEDLSATVKDVTLRADADFKVIRDGGQISGLDGGVRVRIDDMPQAYIAPVWPKSLDDENAKTWIVEKLSEGDLSGLEASMDLALIRDMDAPNEDDDLVEAPDENGAMDITEEDVAPAIDDVAEGLDGANSDEDDMGEWRAEASNLRASFAFTGMQVNYRDPLPPVTNAVGSGVFNLDEESLAITVEEGELGGLRVNNAQLIFTNIIEGGKGMADLTIPLQGPLVKAFEYISTEPIGLKEELDMDLAVVKGDADLEVKLEFPAVADLKMEQVKIDVSGNADNVFLPNVVKGLPVTGGPFAFSVDNERYTVKGSGAFSGRPVQAEWQEFLNSEGKKFKHQAKVQIAVDPELREHFGIDISDFVTGTAPVNLTYTGYRSGGSIIKVDANLQDATLKLEPFKYIKKPGAQASASFQVELQGETPKTLTALKVRAPNVQVEDGSLVFARSGQGEIYVQKADVQRLSVQETVGQVEMETEKSGRMKIIMKGPFLDLRPFLEPDEDAGQRVYDEPPMLISVAVDQMRTTDEDTVQYGKLYADIDNKGRFNQLEMDAIVGGGDIYLRYKPDASGLRTFRFEADNAGAALKAFGVYSQILGGKIVVYAEPIDNVYDRNLVGLAEMTNFKVVDAPVLAQLMGAMSLPGLIELLDGDGVSFSKLEANFDWLYRPQGGLLVLKDGRTSGNSLGLTFDGVFDNPAQRIDVSGTIIPLSGINKVVSSIPLIGDILSGGSGAIFAATYTVQGDSKNPDIDVNPLAALAPGILRRILFE